MSARREYEIAFVGLKPGVHQYRYEIKDRFFEAFQPQDFRQCDAIVNLQLDKKSSFMVLKFDIDGNIQASCDRCGNDLPIKLWDEFQVVVKYADDPEKMNEEEEDPEVYYISRGESLLYVGDWIFEFINLAVPFQKQCEYPEMDGPNCNQEVLKLLNNMNADQHPQQHSLWKGLEQFRKEDQQDANEE